MTHSPAPEEAIRLLPCPWCGSADIKPHGGSRWLYCMSCKSEGPYSDNKAAAIAAWNRRAGGEREQRLEARSKAFLQEFDEFMKGADWYPDYLAEVRNELLAALAGQTEGERNGG